MNNATNESESEREFLRQYPRLKLEHTNAYMKANTQEERDRIIRALQELELSKESCIRSQTACGAPHSRSFFADCGGKVCLCKQSILIEEVHKAYRQGWKDAHNYNNPNVGMFFGPENAEEGSTRYIKNFL